MFTHGDMVALLAARSFSPFRLIMSDGGAVEVRSSEQVLSTRRYALIGLLDPGAAENVYDRHTFVWYMHVARTEMLGAGPPPFSPPPPSGSESPVPSMG